MKVLLTGASGFLGSEIIVQLSVHKDINIVALTSSVQKLEEKYSGCENILVCSIDNFYSDLYDFGDIDYVINCAFPRGEEGKNFAKGLDYIDALLKKVTKAPLKGFIDISSQSVYSQKRLKPADESEPICLESKYAVGKYMVEKLVDAYCVNIPHVHIRMASLIGKDFDVRIVNKLVKKVIQGEEIVIQGGEQCFGFLDVRDAADAIIQLLLCEDSWGIDAVYNLGPDRAYTLNEIVDCIDAERRKFSLELSVKRAEENELMQNSSLNTDKFKRVFGWKPKYSLNSTIYDIIHSELQ